MQLRLVLLSTVFSAIGLADVTYSANCSAADQTGQTTIVQGTTSCLAQGDYGTQTARSSAGVLTPFTALGLTPVTDYSNAISVYTIAEGGVSTPNGGMGLDIEAESTTNEVYSQEAASVGDPRQGFIDIHFSDFNNSLWGSAIYSAQIGQYSLSSCTSPGGCILPFELGEPFALSMTLRTEMISSFDSYGGGSAGVSFDFSLLESDGVTQVGFYDPPAVPEPGALLLVGIGLTVIGIAGRKRHDAHV